MFDQDGHGRRRIPEPDLVPILDGLTSVIFYLLLTAAFIEYTKLTLPPSMSSPAGAASTNVPLSPKILVKIKDARNLQITLKWAGTRPDQMTRIVARNTKVGRSEELENNVREIIAEFTERFKEEKTMSLGLSKMATYQEMVSVMDGIQSKLQDVVLIGPEEVDAM